MGARDGPLFEQLPPRRLPGQLRNSPAVPKILPSGAQWGRPISTLQMGEPEPRVGCRPHTLGLCASRGVRRGQAAWNGSRSGRVPLPSPGLCREHAAGPRGGVTRAAAHRAPRLDATRARDPQPRATAPLHPVPRTRADGPRSAFSGAEPTPDRCSNSAISHGSGKPP